MFHQVEEPWTMPVPNAGKWWRKMGRKKHLSELGNIQSYWRLTKMRQQVEKSVEFRLSLLLLFSYSVVSDSFWPHGLQHARPPCPSPTPRSYSNSCPLRQRCHPTISSSVTTLSSCLQPFPESGSFQVNQLFTSGGQTTGDSVSASVLPMNIQGWFHLGLTGSVSLLSKELARVFSSTTI